MCTKQEVQEVISENNKLRDAQFDLKLEKKLNENNDKIFQHISKVLSHSTPSPKTAASIECIQRECNARATSIALTNQEMKNIKTKVDSIEETVNGLNEKFDLILQANNKKFAAKWVEKGAVMLITIAVGAIVYKVLELAGLKK